VRPGPPGRPPAREEGRGTGAGHRGERLPLSSRGRQPGSRSGAGGRAPRYRAQGRPHRSGALAERPRPPCRRLAERHLTGRARPARPLARHPARPEREAQHDARRAPPRRRRPRLSARPARRPLDRERRRAHPLLDDPRAGLRAYVLRLGPGESATASIVHKGVELVTVATGLVQVRLTGGQPVLRGGEALLAGSSRIEGWRNLSDREALVFWILRDEPSRASDGD